MSELWKTVDEHPNYEVSNLGRIKNAKTNYLLRASLNTDGYEQVGLKGKSCLVHVLVAKAFIPNPNNRPQVDHIDQNKTNNNVTNLRWLTNQQNGFNKNAKGYCFYKPTGKYLAQIQLDGKKMHLGYFLAEQQARDAYLAAKRIYHKIDGVSIPEKIIVKVTLKSI